MSGTDQQTLIRYGVGALLIIAGGVLYYMGYPQYGIGVAAIGAGLLGYTFYKSRIKK